MSRPGVTYLDVAHAAQQVMASGQEPTIERIRAQLKTGSHGTIGTHLRTWRSRQDPLHQLATREKIPEELIVLLKGLWERVVGQAEAQMEALKKETQQDNEQLKDHVLQQQRENARLQQAEAQLKQAHHSVAQEKMAVEQLLSKAQTEAATLRTQQEGLLQQLADKQTRVEELHRHNQQTQANLEHYHASALEQRHADQQRAEQQYRQLEQDFSQLNIENERLRQEKQELMYVQQQLEQAQKSIQSQLDKITLEHEKVSAALIEARQELAQKTALLAHLHDHTDQIQAQLQQQLQLNGELSIERATLVQRIETHEKALETLTEQHKALAHDKWVLGQEKAQLFGQFKQLEAMR